MHISYGCAADYAVFHCVRVVCVAVSFVSLVITEVKVGLLEEVKNHMLRTATTKLRQCRHTSRLLTTSNEDIVEVYNGAFAKPLRLVKKISLTSVGASITGSVVLFASDPSLGMLGLGTVLSSFGIGTTAMLHWLTKPYITSLSVRNGEQEKSDYIIAKTLTLSGQDTHSKFSINDIAPPSASHPFSVFHANGREYHISVDAVDDLYVANALSEVTPEQENPSTTSTTQHKI